MAASRGKSPEIELLWWSECPSWERALDELRAAVRELGLDDSAIRLRQVETDTDAEQEGFIGSPTIRVNGRDIQPPGPEEPLGLTCRIYRLRDGRVSPLPDPADVREALVTAIDEGSRA